MTVAPPVGDEDVPRFWRDLGLPGVVDVHTHFMPASVMTKVWAFFDRIAQAGAGTWPITYRGSDDERVAILGRLGVRGFTALAYAHKPDMAEWLNGWTIPFAHATPGCVPSATFYPEPGVDRYVAEALDAGARVFKVHLGVGRFDPRDPLLRSVWGRLAREAVPVVVHAGSGPHYADFTGPGPFGEVLDAHDGLVAVTAHFGGPDYAAFVELARRHAATYLDTTMVFTAYMARLGAPWPEELTPALVELADQIVLGTDFPNIPYPYAEQLRGLAALDLGDDWLRAVCHDNGARLLGLDPPPRDPQFPGSVKYR